MQRRKVAVFFGGRSNEHDISVITGMLAVNLLRGSAFEAVPVYLPKEGGMATGDMHAVGQFRTQSADKWTRVRLGEKCLLRERGKRRVSEIDVALNCCHGGMGENGVLSALLEWNGIPSASPPMPVSAVFMDKGLGKIAAKGLGLCVLPSFVAREGEEASERAKALGYPVIVKPVGLGSSIGIAVARDKDELSAALSLAFRLDGAALVEKYLEGKRDLNCAAYRKEGKTVLSPVEEVFSSENILTFAEKYEGRGQRRSRIPADIDPALEQEVKEGTRALYEAFATRGVVRADFLLCEGKVYFNELNTVPGSLACYLFGDTLSDAKKLLLSLLKEALAKQPPREILSTGILQSDLFSGAKGCKRR